MQGIIYKYTNKITGKHYIGQTIHPEQRARNHKHEALVAGSDYYFHKSIRKYGLENFDYSVLEECENTLLSEREAYHIKEFNSYWPNGYNMLPSSNSMTDEIRLKISNTKKHQWASLTPEEKEKAILKLTRMSEKRKGSSQSNLQKQRAAAANSKRYLIQHPNGHQEDVTNLRSFMQLHNVRNIWKPGMKSKGYINLRELPNDYNKYHAS